MIRYLVNIFLIIMISSCVKTPEDKLKVLKNNWLKEDTLQISQERLSKRFKTALNYLENHKRWDIRIGNCGTISSDTLRTKSINFKVAQKPFLDASLDKYVYSQLKHKWACKTFEQPIDSLRDRVSKYVTKPSKETNLIGTYVSKTLNKVKESRTISFRNRTDLVSNILKELPSDDKSTRTIIFELPTGKTIRAYMPSSYSNLLADWDSLKYHPAQVMFDTFAAEEAIIFFNEKDQIEKVWWGSWME